jgi:hypothetical protein
MRPKRDVIVYCTNSATLSRLALVLSVRLKATTIIKAETIESLLQSVSDSKDLGCAVVMRLRDDGLSYLELPCPCVEVLPQSSSPAVIGSMCIFSPFDRAFLIQSVKLACVRKRGPKNLLEVAA